MIFIDMDVAITAIKMDKSKRISGPRSDFKKIRHDCKLRETLQNKLDDSLNNLYHHNPDHDPSISLTNFSSILYEFLLQEVPRQHNSFRKDWMFGHEDQLGRLYRRKRATCKESQRNPTVQNVKAYKEAFNHRLNSPQSPPPTATSHININTHQPYHHQQIILFTIARHTNISSGSDSLVEERQEIILSSLMIPVDS